VISDRLFNKECGLQVKRYVKNSMFALISGVLFTVFFPRLWFYEKLFLNCFNIVAFAGKRFQTLAIDPAQ